MPDKISYYTLFFKRKRKFFTAAAVFVLAVFVIRASAVIHRRHCGWAAKASYYGRPFHGRSTASGEKHDMYALTASHKALPFGTLLEVTNLHNGRSVIVRINDRGPYVRGRELDLSVAAARLLKIKKEGVARVKIKIIQ